MTRRGLILLGVVLLVAISATGQEPFFDRAGFVEKIRAAFTPIEEKYLLPLDHFDYDGAVLFSGRVNGSEEHVIILPLTSGSHSYDVALHLGTTLAWKDVSDLPLFAVLILRPTDCITGLAYDTPYLVRANSWDRAEIIDYDGNYVRNLITWWHRGDPEPAFYKFSGNWLIHLETCTTASSNQW